jgi:hypothetical protein
MLSYFRKKSKFDITIYLLTNFCLKIILIVITSLQIKKEKMFIVVNLLVIIASTSFSSSSAQDFSQGYGLSFSFADPSIPFGTCAQELEQVRIAVFPTYATEMVEETLWTEQDFVNEDWNTAFIFARGRNKGGRSLRKSSGRRLAGCIPCPTGQLLMVTPSCWSMCKKRRMLDATTSLENQERSENDRELESLRGSKWQLLSGYGGIAASSVYNYAETNITGPCKDIILNMKYERFVDGKD